MGVPLAGVAEVSVYVSDEAQGKGLRPEGLKPRVRPVGDGPDGVSRAKHIVAGFFPA
jgi:hypothetical protein